MASSYNSTGFSVVPWAYRSLQEKVTIYSS